MLEGLHGAIMIPATAKEISRAEGADGKHRAVFTRDPPAYPRGMARPPGERKGFTPTVRMLELLLPLYNANKYESGISMYRLREELVKQVGRAEEYLLPTLEQLHQAWKVENERKFKRLLAINSRVVVSDSKASSSSSSSSSQDEWTGTVVRRQKSHWYIKRDGADDAAKPVEKQAKDQRLHPSDPLFGTQTHGGRRKATADT